jgi:hypothetical protein
MFGRLLGRAWGGHVPSRFIVVAGLLFGGWLLFATHGIGKSQPVVAQNPPLHFRVHEARPATARVDPNWLWEKTPDIAPAAPQYAAPAPVYSYPSPSPSPAAMQYAYLQQQYLYAQQRAAMPPRFVYAGHGFGFGHAFGGFGHFGHGGRR